MSDGSCFRHCSKNVTYSFGGIAQTGFTLLEVLIAIGITALIGLGTWQLLGGTIRAEQITEKNSDRFEQLQKAMLLLSRDITQVNSRSIRDEYGEFQPAISNRNALYVLALTRSGWRNPMADRRSDLQRVAYELVDGELLRHYWQVLDRSQDSESVFQTLLTDIDSITLRFMDENAQWSEGWPPDTSNSSSNSNSSDSNIINHLLPKAVEITVNHNYFGTLTRLYDLPQYVSLSSAQGQNSGSTGGGSGANGN